MARIVFLRESEDLFVAAARELVADAVLGGLMPGTIPESEGGGTWLVRKTMSEDGRPLVVELHTYRSDETLHEGKVRAVNASNVAYVESPSGE